MYSDCPVLAVRTGLLDLENPNNFTAIHKFSRKVMVKTAFIIVNG